MPLTMCTRSCAHHAGFHFLIMSHIASTDSFGVACARHRSTRLASRDLGVSWSKRGPTPGGPGGLVTRSNGHSSPSSASPHVSSRSRSLITVAAYHLPPVALAILRRFSSAAALCADKPASLTGRIRSARAAASLALRSDPAVQPPSFTPRRLAAARPPLVRCEMSAAPSAPARRIGGGRRGQRRRQAP